MVTIPWYKIRKPILEGGLEISSLMSFNEVANLKLYWDLLTSTESWALLLKSRV